VAYAIRTLICAVMVLMLCGHTHVFACGSSEPSRSQSYAQWLYYQYLINTKDNVDGNCDLAQRAAANLHSALEAIESAETLAAATDIVVGKIFDPAERRAAVEARIQSLPAFAQKMARQSMASIPPPSPQEKYAIQIYIAEPYALYALTNNKIARCTQRYGSNGRIVEGLEIGSDFCTPKKEPDQFSENSLIASKEQFSSDHEENQSRRSVLDTLPDELREFVTYTLPKGTYLDEDFWNFSRWKKRYGNDAIAEYTFSYRTRILKESEFIAFIYTAFTPQGAKILAEEYAKGDQNEFIQVANLVSDAASLGTSAIVKKGIVLALNSKNAVMAVNRARRISFKNAKHTKRSKKILREMIDYKPKNKKDNPTLGSASREEIDAMGRDWIGSDAVEMIDNHKSSNTIVGYRNLEKTRMYRFPELKKETGKITASFYYPNKNKNTQTLHVILEQ